MRAALPPTRSRGINRSSDPCLRKTLPAVCCGLMPTPSALRHRELSGAGQDGWKTDWQSKMNGISPLVMIALVCAGTLNCTTAGEGALVSACLHGLASCGAMHQHAVLFARGVTSSAANLSTAVKGACSGTLNTLNGSFGSEVRTTLKVTLACPA